MLDKNFRWILSLIVILSLGTSCNTENDNAVNLNNGKYGGIVRINMTDTPSSFYPPQAVMSGSITMIQLVHETLLKYDTEKDSIVGNLVDRWEVNETGDVYTFHLKKDIFFHDNACFPDGKGRALNASDIAFCFTNLCKIDNKNRYAPMLTNQIKGGAAVKDITDDSFMSGIEIIDDLTFKINLTQPSYTFLNLMTHSASSIYAKEALDFYKDKITNNPVGTGPFTVKANVANKTTIFKRNDNYWQKDENGDRLPYIDGIKFTYEEEEKVILEAAGNKTFDILLNPSANLSSQVSSQSHYNVAYNPSYAISYYSIPVNEPVYDNVDFRKALNYAIDRSYIVDSILLGKAAHAKYGIIPETFSAYKTDGGYSYNPELAKKHLTNAGYTGNDKLPKVKINITNSSDGVRIGQAIQKMFMDNLGIISEVAALDPTTHYDKYDEGELQLAYVDWSADYRDPDNFLCLYYSALTPDNGGFNAARYNNPAFDKALMNGMNEFDAVKRKHFYSQADQILFDDAAIIPLYSKQFSCIVAENVKDVDLNSSQELGLTKCYFMATEQ